MSEKTPVGFAGLGLMGSRMAANVLRAGFPTTVWNRTPSKAHPLSAAGAHLAASPSELASKSSVIVTMLADPAAVREVYLTPNGLLAGDVSGKTFVDMSTIGPTEARAMAAEVAARGGRFVDCPVTGSRDGAAAGKLILMASGEAAALDAFRPVADVVGSKLIVVANEPGAASHLKLVGNLLISFMLEGLCEGLVLAKKGGVSPEAVLELVAASGYASPYYDFKGKAILARDFQQHFSIDLMHKDLGLALAEGAHLAAPLPGLAVIRETYSAARAAGDGQADICGVVKVIEGLAGTKV